jgi:hypothetical protein
MALIIIILSTVVVVVAAAAADAQPESISQSAPIDLLPPPTGVAKYFSSSEQHKRSLL